MDEWMDGLVSMYVVRRSGALRRRRAQRPDAGYVVVD